MWKTRERKRKRSRCEYRPHRWCAPLPRVKRRRIVYICRLRVEMSYCCSGNALFIIPGQAGRRGRGVYDGRVQGESARRRKAAVTAPEPPVEKNVWRRYTPTGSSGRRNRRGVLIDWSPKASCLALAPVHRYPQKKQKSRRKNGPRIASGSFSQLNDLRFLLPRLLSNVWPIERVLFALTHPVSL